MLNPEKTRVLLVSMHTSPVDQPGTGDAGGMNVYVLHLARSLAVRGWAVDLATLNRDASRAEGVTVSDVVPGVRLLAVSVPGAASARKEHLPAYTAAFGRALIDFYGHRPPALVHAHYWLSGVAAREACDAWRVPLLLSLHTAAAVKNLRAGPDETPEPRARQDAERQLLAAACVSVVNTPAEAEQLETLYGADPHRLRVIPPGVDPAIFHPTAAMGAGAAHGASAAGAPPAGAATTGATEPTNPCAPVPFTVLCAGRMQPLKGPQVLVAALGVLRREHPACRIELVLAGVGEPSFLDRLHALAHAEGVSDAVTFLGSMPSPALADRMRAADAVAMPSSSETFGLVALEAQACGTPVLATDVDGLRFAVADGVTGWLVPGRQPRQWADALHRAASNPQLWRAMSRAAAQRAGAYTWDAVAERHELAYTSCTARAVTA